ncbi:MAG: hypothetical protein BWY63_02402 [Chloroflexi bacterium ADurb.Bin360]|nr:MAG: hypothetical protein BWY63_02402 [Chloroflexi bacterium ADurb.Bin360]
MNLHPLPTHANFALIWAIKPDQNIHQRTLTRTVFAQQRQHFTGVELEVHMIIGEHAREPFSDPQHFENWLRLIVH